MVVSGIEMCYDSTVLLFPEGGPVPVSGRKGGEMRPPCGEIRHTQEKTRTDKEFVNMNKGFTFLIVGICAFAVPVAFSQPIGSPITYKDDTPTYAELTPPLVPIHTEVPMMLGQTPNDDREQKLCVLDNGTTVVFWVNKGGSHHVNGMDRNGNRIFPVFTDGGAADIIVGVNTGSNTNWTLCKNKRGENVFLAAATWTASSLSNSDAIIPETVIDADGIVEDDGQGHGFFMLFDGNLQPITGPISISQFSAGHRDWDCCWLNDGKFVIVTNCQNHRYEGDPDYSSSNNKVATINIFNSDGSRFKDEFFTNDVTGKQEAIRCGALANGFVVMFSDSDNGVTAEFYDNNGNLLGSKFPIRDSALNAGATWMEACGGDLWVTVHEGATIPDGFAPLPELAGVGVVLAQLWNASGDPIGPPILVSQHSETRSLGRNRVAMAPNGSFAVSWQDGYADDVTFTECTVARVFNADGTPATDAFIPHNLPEFPPDKGGKPGQLMPGMNNEFVAFAWGTQAFGNCDCVVSVFPNPAKGTGVSDWEPH